MWSHYYSVPRDEEKTALQIASLTSVLANVNGNKTTTSDFVFDFSKKEKQSSNGQTKAEKMREKMRIRYGRK